ncbi:hypothetical protein TRFO_18633 [Tritrichomonas foetus]|uniref:Conserved oligomeric Golgi complex subunit 7 n=1 Tax=Tritrichomonas foetus TaxID=1144522 RepID=A0A1J4KL15_9EUKA|nr:hypothetical protein TRFO_18633 [Tritrichomonas foetus]|eukprot:OHT11834.1 hypothetical protein TRFO_18633 [Tritrichomonas foetus]
MNDEFKDPNFNVDDWINANLNFKEGEDAKRYEELGNQLVTRLQMRSREISLNADQNMRGLVDALPQGMAKLKHISDTVNELSDSLRSLTNSGYKFKSGNVPDRIGELTSLKVRRDRLKDAAEKLQHGIDIEADLQQLQSDAAIGDLQKVCEKYQNVSKAAKSLSTISKFDTIKNNLQIIQKTIANRITPELNSACLRLNGDTFSRYSKYSGQIGLNELPQTVILKTFHQQIDKERTTYDCDPPLPITDWLPTCLNRCHDYFKNFSNWTKTIGFSLNSELFQTFTEVLSPTLDSHMKMILNSSKFDDLVIVFRMINEFSLKINNENVFKENIVRIQVLFPDSLQIFLNSTLNLPQQMPKSNTTGSLSRNPPPSPSRSTEMLSNPQSTNKAANSKNEHNPKLLETCINVSMRALEWIKNLAKEPIRCLRTVNIFLQQSIQFVTNDLKNYLGNEATKYSGDEQQQILFLGKLLQMFTSQESLEKKLKLFEDNGKKIDDSFQVPSIQNVKDVIEVQILDTMAMKSLSLLNGLHNASEWADEGDDEFDTLDQSRYVKAICLNIMAMLQQLTQGKHLSNELISKWTTKTAETVVKSYAKEISNIPKLSKHGQDQLKTDIEYLLNLLGVMGLEGGKDLPGILSILSAENNERKKAFEEAGVSPEIARGLSVSLSIS